MRRKAFVLFAITCFLILAGCEKPKVERIWGSITSVGGHYCNDSNYKPADCRIVVQFKETEIITVYMVDYDRYGPKDQIEYRRCRSALLLKKEMRFPQ